MTWQANRANLTEQPAAQSQEKAKSGKTRRKTDLAGKLMKPKPSQPDRNHRQWMQPDEKRRKKANDFAGPPRQTAETPKKRMAGATAGKLPPPKWTLPGPKRRASDFAGEILARPATNSRIIKERKTKLLTCPTARVTCGWAGRDKTLRAGFCSGVENARKCRRIPPVKCTLCWAALI